MMFILITLVVLLTEKFVASEAYYTKEDKQRTTPVIVGGTTTQPGDWPWQVLLEKNGRFQCGGTLHKRRMTKRLRRNVAAGKSSRYMVITAAHCVKNVVATYTIVTGEHDRSVATGFEQELSVKNVVIHENYSEPLPSVGKNDIAILFLEKVPRLNEFVEPIQRLSTRKLDRKALKSSQCFVLGWGDTTLGLERTFSDILLQLNTQILENVVCKEGLQDFGVDTLITPSNICSDNSDASFCLGDSGGPLLCDIDSIWTHVGIVSWRADACVSPFPNVYARVSKYRKWIRKTDIMEK